MPISRSLWATGTEGHGDGSFGLGHGDAFGPHGHLGHGDGSFGPRGPWATGTVLLANVGIIGPRGRFLWTARDIGTLPLTHIGIGFLFSHQRPLSPHPTLLEYASAAAKADTVKEARS